MLYSAERGRARVRVGWAGIALICAVAGVFALSVHRFASLVGGKTPQRGILSEHGRDTGGVKTRDKWVRSSPAGKQGVEPIVLAAVSGEAAGSALEAAEEPTLGESCRKVEAFLEVLEEKQIIFNCTTTIEQCRDSVNWYGIMKRFRNKAGFWVPGEHRKLWLKAWTGEFGAEMDLPMPWAYTLHRCGLLHQTSGCGELQVFYFFSPRHARLRTCARLSVPKQFMGTDIRFQSVVQQPRYRTMLDVDAAGSVSLWPPPLAAHCRRIDAERPLLSGAVGRPVLVIANKYSREWDGPPVSFYGVREVEMIMAAFDSVCPGGSVVYMRARAKGTMGMVDDAGFESDLYDGATGMDDFSTVRRHDNAIVVNDLWAQSAKAQQNHHHHRHHHQHHPEKPTKYIGDTGQETNDAPDPNEAQCRAFARARCFVSVQGGIQHVLRYFGGRQMIVHPRGYETYSPSEGVMGGGTLYYTRNETRSIVEGLPGFLAPGGACMCAWNDGSGDD